MYQKPILAIGLMLVLTRLGTADEIVIGPELKLENKIGYKTVKEAREDLLDQNVDIVTVSKAIEMAMQGEGARTVIWFFTTKSLEAYPALVKYETIEHPYKKNSVSISNLCENEKDVCRRFLDGFSSTLKNSSVQDR